MQAQGCVLGKQKNIWRGSLFGYLLQGIGLVQALFERMNIDKRCKIFKCSTQLLVLLLVDER